MTVLYRALAILLLAGLGVPHLGAQSRAEQRTARHFESIRNSPPEMLAFLRAMPKGGDLHSHLSGAVYAESYIRWGAADGACVSRTTLAASAPPCDAAAGEVQLNTALTDAGLYRA